MARHVIVDGSNIATEGRQMPSLKQLNEAVTAFMQEFPDDVITVVVDATFGHRIDPSEVAEFDEAIAHNELVAPPAGAIGRGDSFILSIANKTKGSILTNDSYQEFHGEYPWVFDEGRLIGGKPVPNVGWVFVLRTPVRGPVSRKSVRAGRSVDKNTGRVPRASKEASRPMPVPKAPPPGATLGKGGRPAVAVATDGAQLVAVPAESRADGGRRRGRRDGRPATEALGPEAAPAATAAAARPVPARDEPVNELMAFINFVEHHPVGSSVNAVVESYSSHGAYVAVGNVRGYVPLRLMSDPPARSARELGKVGDAVTLVVHSFTPARRSIDMAVPAAAMKDGVTPASVPVEPHAAETAAIAEAAVIATADTVIAPAAEAPSKPARRPRKAAATAGGTGQPAVAGTAAGRTGEGVPGEPAPEVAPSKPTKRAGRRAAVPAAPEPTTTEPTAAEAPAPAKPARRPRKAAQEPAAVAPAPAKRAAKNATAVAESATVVPAAPPAKKAAPAKKAGATPAATAPAKKAAATAAPRKKAAATQPAGVSDAPSPPPAKRAAKKAPAKPAAAPAAKPTPAKKAAAKKSPAKKSPAKD